MAVLYCEHARLAVIHLYRSGAGPAEPRREVGNCLGRQAYWGGKLYQEKKRRKGEGKSEKIEESEKRKERENKERYRKETQ